MCSPAENGGASPMPAGQQQRKHSRHWQCPHRLSREHRSQLLKALPDQPPTALPKRSSRQLQRPAIPTSWPTSEGTHAPRAATSSRPGDCENVHEFRAANSRRQATLSLRQATKSLGRYPAAEASDRVAGKRYTGMRQSRWAESDQVAEASDRVAENCQ